MSQGYAKPSPFCLAKHLMSMTGIVSLRSRAMAATVATVTVATATALIVGMEASMAVVDPSPPTVRDKKVESAASPMTCILTSKAVIRRHLRLRVEGLMYFGQKVAAILPQQHDVDADSSYRIF